MVEDAASDADSGESHCVDVNRIVGSAHRLVVGQDIGVKRQAPLIQDATADAVDDGGVPVRQATGDPQPADGHRLTGTDSEDSADIVAADRQLLGAGTFDVEVLGNVQLAGGQRDGVDLLGKRDRSAVGCVEDRLP